MARSKVRRRKVRQLRKRDGDFCWYCSLIMRFTHLDSRRPPGTLDATIDHVIPRSEGGTSAYHNLRLAHQACNSSRHHAPKPKVVKKVENALIQWYGVFA